MPKGQHSFVGLLTRPARRAYRSMPVAWFLSSKEAAARKLSAVRLNAGPALVLGMAPDAVRPIGLAETWSVVTANVAHRRAHEWGLAPPRLSIIRQMADKEDTWHQGKLWEQLSGLRTEHLFTVGQDDYGRRIAALAARHNYSYGAMTLFTTAERARLIHEVTGLMIIRSDLMRGPSNGVLGAVYALWLGAPAVVMSGFTLAPGVYNYALGIGTLAQRPHYEGDKRVLSALVRKGLPVFTSDKEFAAQSGIRLWDEATAEKFTVPAIGSAQQGSSL